MQDESKGNYDIHESNMSKSKGGMIAENRIQNSKFSRQSSLLTDNGNKLKILNSASDRTLKVAWNPKNHKLAFGGDNEMAYMWDMAEDLESAKRIANLPHALPEHAKSSTMYEKIAVTSLDWKPDGNMLITGSTDGICRLWDDKGECCKIMFNELSMPLKQSNAYSPGGAGDSKVSTRPDDFDSINSCQWNKDGSAFVTVSDKNNVILWNTEGKMKHSFQGHTDSVL
jgi:WD40 repeat protein